MTIPIEGYAVVMLKSRIQHLLDDGTLKPANCKTIADDHLWSSSFMTQEDAFKYRESLEELDINGTQGPDSDLVIVNEFDQSVTPYCEWLASTRWEKAIIAWKVGTDPQNLFTYEGWDPKVGSGLLYGTKEDMKDMEFVRVEGNVEVYRDKNSGKELFIGRTSTPVEAYYKTASEIIQKHFHNPGQPFLTGQAAIDVQEALTLLDQVLAEEPDWWNALWFYGKGHSSLGNTEKAYEAFRRAFELEKGVEAIPRELAGACLSLNKFDEAVEVNQHAASLQPDNSPTIGNLAIAYLLAGKLPEAEKTIRAALKLDPQDKINHNIQNIINDVSNGDRPQPKSFDELIKPKSIPKADKKKPWQFWKK
ncbi:tetratricopeptide repeat protein [Rubinisphaera italica]|uniref:Tetratricopeptide repeat protein n=1 Tax=Rubinisphaera italica TaxID=2527969 RepID=A0A5C5XH42_9PLAN|nr:tetratricopeptide repeat protein [Rubinisphaera italica]TWT62019.1 Tetratricopeptide repeat protein [Rubinisphaera italica]